MRQLPQHILDLVLKLQNANSCGVHLPEVEKTLYNALVEIELYRCANHLTQEGHAYSRVTGICDLVTAILNPDNKRFNDLVAYRRS